MEFGIYSERIVSLARWVGLAVFALVLMLLVQALLIHVRLTLKERISRHFLDRWRPIMMNALLEVPKTLPPLHRMDYEEFLNLWNHLQESLKGESRQRLNEVARMAGMDRVAAKMIRRGGIGKRLTAITALGYMQDRSVWNELLLSLDSENPAVSLSSARALVLIDAVAAMPFVIPRIAERKEWASFKVANILTEAGADVFSAPLAEAVLRSSEPRMIRLLSLAHYEVSRQAISRILEASLDEEAISACLHVLRDPRDLNLVRMELAHPSWFVRVQAAIAIGKIGVEEDKKSLIRMLGDREWWVRYRSAQALAGLPSMSVQELERLQAEHGDRYARDILTQVLAEKKAA